MYGKRTQQLAGVQDQIYDNQKNSADAIVDDHTLANRKTEMNEWSVNNKKDTLFVYSSLFVMLSGLLLLTGLLRMEMISTTLWIGMGLVLIVVFVLIVINRSHYTNMLRNKRYWNKQIFEGKYGQIPTLICPDVVNSLDVGLNSLGDQARLGAAAARTASADALQNLANQTRNIGT
jgi:hypothetical protein